ncbi:MAG: response regulator [Myxococcota bacterium]|nr:response regulator [Myxococcota bacterium]
MSDSSTHWVTRLGALGDRPGDDDSARLQHRLLVYMGVLMSGGGLLWGSIAASQQLFLPAVIPYGYTLITIANLTYFRLTKQFAVVRFVQVLISLLLPFFFQWSLGGFSPSGAVMLWAMLAIVGSLTFSASRTSMKWLLLYCALTIVSGVLDELVRERFSPDPSEGLRTIFFVVNVVVISSIVFGLTIYLLAERERANDALEQANARITELNEHLEDEVAARTEELASALARSRAIVDNLADGLVALDPEGVVQASNPAIATMLIQGASRAVTREDLPKELLELARTALEERHVARTELSLPGDRIGSAVASPIVSGEGAPVGSVVIVRDVTLEKEVDRMKTDFIATVSHELRTPLTSVLGFAKLTKGKLESAVFAHVPEGDPKARRAVDQVRGNIDIIVSEGQRLTSLINDVLDISKMEAGRMEWKRQPIDPTALVQRAIDASAGLFASGTVELASDVQPELPTIEGDEDRLLQVLLNLISNAAKFTESGKVTVIARQHPEGLELAVRDTGAGIAPGDHDAIFQKFKQVGDTLTNKPKGTGLGLPICKQIVVAHRGRISVESKLGEGATFRVVLPLGSSSARVSDLSLRRLVDRIERTVGPLPSTGGDVLVVDDDASLRELLRQQLGERGYEVRLATNGSEAIHSVRARRPDLIVLDVMMPDISGFDVATILKSDPSTQTIPILILSIVQDAERGYRLGVDKYLTKPTEPEVLLAEVQRLLQRSHATARRVLVVDERSPASPELVAMLQARGYEVVGTCGGERAMDEIRRTKPDLVLVEPNAAEVDVLVRRIRMDEALEHVQVVHFLDPESVTRSEVGLD